MRRELQSKIIEFGNKIDNYLKSKNFTAYDIDKQDSIETIKDFASINKDIISIMIEIFSVEELTELNADGANIINNGNIKILLGEHSGPVNRIASYYLLSELGAYKDYFWVEEIDNVVSQIEGHKKDNNLFWLNKDKTKRVVFKDLNFDPAVIKGDYKEADKRYKEAKIKACAPQEIPLIITTDGKCYLAYKYHYRLANWLAHTGVDLENAIRVRIFYKNNGSLSIEPDYSIKNKRGNEFSNSTFMSMLSEEQVKRIIEIYDCCMINNTHFRSLEEILAKSSSTSGLGFDEDSFCQEVEGKNITTHNNNLFARHRNYYSEDELFSLIKDLKKKDGLER